jgi:hypothetical protein
VGIYVSEGEITIYVAGTQLKFMAYRLLTAMREKIAEENSPFMPLGEREVKQHKVYELEGMGQSH